MMKKFLLLFFAIATLFANAQSTIPLSFQFSDISAQEVLILGNPQIQATEYRIVRLDYDQIWNELNQVSHRHETLNQIMGIISLPTPEGGSITFSTLKNETMHADLAAKYPQIVSLDAYGTNSSAHGKWDITPHGFHAMIFQPGQSTIFIDPLFSGNDEYYIVYRKKNFLTDKAFVCEVLGSEGENTAQSENVMPNYGTCELRTYRIAVAATAEYSIFHGGTKPLALAAQVTTMNRVNGVYERDIAITMTLIPNNDTLIYTSNPDPYSNGQTFQMINQNQSNINSVIGSANYDVGHVFGTNSGGLAGLGVICNNSQKARGVTGSGAPIGDPFDIDYVAHELGHQFGANHTQNNSCNSVSTASFEPGSASTIMGYAGICSPNVQNNSDDYFHGHSLSEISAVITDPFNNCAQITTLNNTAPTIVTTPGNITIPRSTPFMLTANATDPDGDSLTYLWEQFDAQASVQPPSPNSFFGPNFRSISPDTNGTRYFPNFNSVINNTNPTWEVLPAVARTMNFRVSVRDNHVLGSCNEYQEITVTTASNAGPFEVLTPNAAAISWASGGTETVTWDVSNTDIAPVNCDSVRILFSSDGGQTFTTILNSTPNDGSEIVNVPAITTNQARIMIVSQNGTFYDVSDNNFNVINCTPADIPTVSAGGLICSNDSITLSVLGGTLNDSQQWTWYTGTCGGNPVGTGTSIDVSPAITTTYYVRGSGGCPGSGCATVTVSVIPLFNIFVSQNGATLTVAQSNVNYQWVDCDNNFSPIPGANSQSFTPSALTGSYACVLESNGCLDTTDCFLVDQIGLAENEIGFELYPNPASHSITIQSHEMVDRVEILDMSGRRVFATDVHDRKIMIQTGGLRSGMYVVRIWSDQKPSVRRVILDNN